MYSVTDFTELIRYHLVLSTDDVESVNANLAQLVRNIEDMVLPICSDESSYWTVCEDCGAWVSSDLINAEGAGECADGGFRCTECRFNYEVI